MNATFTLLELRRVVRDFVSMFFIVALPGFFFLIFGAATDFSAERVGNGNVAMYVMISMAAYGAVTATTGVGGMAAVERMQGWGRQLGLTPLRDSGYVAMKALVAIVIAALPVALVYALGVATTAEGSGAAWVLSALLVMLGAGVFAIYGLAVGLAFRSEAAVSAASGLLVIMAFLGNIFIPLSGTLLTIAKLTPLYGYVALARYPLTEGYLVDGSREPLWVAAANVAAWAAIFGLVAIALVRRGRERQ